MNVADKGVSMSAWSWHRRRSTEADDMSRRHSSGDAFLDALDDAEELLKYLGEVGHPVPAPIINDILTARAALAANADSPAVRAANPGLRARALAKSA